MTTALSVLTKEFAGKEKEFTSMLPAGMDPKRFLRTAVNGIATHQQVDKLLAADRKSLFTACQKAAADGLAIDGREATLVVFKDKVAMLPMAQGLVKLARNSGEIASIMAEIVHENDGFTYRPGIDPQPDHRPDWFESNGPRGRGVGAYAVITLKDGEKIVSVMPWSRIKAAAQAGRNTSQYDQDHGAYWQEWWRKTVIRNVLKYAPKSTALEGAIIAAQEAENEGEPFSNPGNGSAASAVNSAVTAEPDKSQAPEPEPVTIEAEYEEEDLI